MQQVGGLLSTERLSCCQCAYLLNHSVTYLWQKFKDLVLTIFEQILLRTKWDLGSFKYKNISSGLCEIAAVFGNDKAFWRVFLNEKLTYPVSNALYFAKAFFLLARVGSIWLLLCCLCTFILWARHFVSFSLCLSKRFKNSHFIGSFCSGDSSEFLPPTPGDYQIRLPDWPSMLRRTKIYIAKYCGNCFQAFLESLRKYR